MVHKSKTKERTKVSRKAEDMTDLDVFCTFVAAVYYYLFVTLLNHLCISLNNTLKKKSGFEHDL